MFSIEFSERAKGMKTDPYFALLEYVQGGYQEYLNPDSDFAVNMVEDFDDSDITDAMQKRGIPPKFHELVQDYWQDFTRIELRGNEVIYDDTDVLFAAYREDAEDTIDLQDAIGGDASELLSAAHKLQCAGLGQAANFSIETDTMTPSVFYSIRKWYCIVWSIPKLIRAGILPICVDSEVQSLYDKAYAANLTLQHYLISVGYSAKIQKAANEFENAGSAFENALAADEDTYEAMSVIPLQARRCRIGEDDTAFYDRDSEYIGRVRREIIGSDSYNLMRRHIQDTWICFADGYVRL